ncbi:type III PLP-dependent enzyme [Saccharospirillum impatiens]|uniref:type III PLP-dependent enzyme n=1 Tax=Saccharospirillum impatiens TaxID=169438 RepID=UPI000414A907|nr:type III PLP-dependent enzyme [Saccharospirillum impatiens]
MIHHDPNRVPTVIQSFCRRLADNADDPVSAFVYDLDALVQRVRWLRSHLPEGVELFYAIKANSEASILNTLAPWVDGFDLSSGGEVQKVIGSDLTNACVLSGPGKLDSELRLAITAGVERVHLESLDEIRRLNTLAAEAGITQRVLLRVNPVLPQTLSSRLSMAGQPTPFGIEERQLAEAVKRVEGSEHLELGGFHVHAMSHQTDLHRHQPLLDGLLDKWPIWQALAEHPATITQLNVGGGMGVNYLGPDQFNWPALCQHLHQRLAWLSNPPRVRFEPGRFITAYCGYYLMQIIDLKHNHGEEFAVCRGGTHHFRLPAAQEHDHPVVHLPADPGRGGSERRVTVVGQLCTPKDVMARGVRMTEPRRGDLLVLPLAGAYGYNISHADFLCHPRPDLHFIHGGSI